MLQLLASRPQSSRPGISIASQLIDAGVPVESGLHGARPPFALSLINQVFDLSDVLHSHGAKVNELYQMTPDGPWVTVLAELAQTHTKNSLTALRHLLKVVRSHSLEGEYTVEDKLANTPLVEQELDFIVDKTNRLSVLQILSACSPEVMNDDDQVSARIIQAVLSTFRTPEQPNYSHPILGTALCVASMSRNLTMVDELLSRGADTTLAAQPEHFSRDLLVAPEFEIIFNIFSKATPTWLALAGLSAELARAETAELVSKDISRRFDEHERVIEKLLDYTPDEYAREEWIKLQKKRKEFDSRRRLERDRDSVSEDERGTSSLPVDLSTEEAFQPPLPDARPKHLMNSLSVFLYFMRRKERFGTISRAQLEVLIREADSGVCMIDCENCKNRLN